MYYCKIDRVRWCVGSFVCLFVWFWRAELILKSALFLAFDQESGSQLLFKNNILIILQTLPLIKKSFNDSNIFTAKA